MSYFKCTCLKSFDNHAKGGLEHFEIFHSLITIDHLHIQ